jgi:hypothetical protein
MKKTEIKQYIDDYIDDYKGTACEELHQNLFNTDYYIIGTYKATQWLGSDTFRIIEAIKEYEQDNFGEVSTDFSNPEKIVNMFAYIRGEEIINNMLNDLEIFGEHVTESNIKRMTEYLTS